MKTKARILFTLAVFLLTAQFAFAQSSAVKLSKLNDRFFYLLSGTDKNGKPSYVYIQGTIHLGDDRLYPLADEVLDAWKNADRLVAEVSTQDMARLTTAVQSEMFASYRRAKGRNLYDGLTEDEMAVLYTLIDGSQIDMYGAFEPWVLNTVLASLSYYDIGLESDYGMDNVFMQMAEDEGRLIEGLDTLRTQLDILKFGTYDEQLYILKQSIEAFMDESKQKEDLVNLYEAYISGDEKTLDRLVHEDDFEEDERELGEAYNKALYLDRNAAWAVKIADWLNEGGVTFIFAGSGHFIGDDSVFAQLRKNGVIK